MCHLYPYCMHIIVAHDGLKDMLLHCCRREENGDRYGRWQGEYSNSHRGDSNSHSGGSSYAQRVSRLSTRTGSSAERSRGERSRSEHRREHLRWEDYSDDEDEPLPPKPQHSRRYGRR